MKVVSIAGNRRTRAGASCLALSLSFVVSAVAVGCGGSSTNTTTKAAAQQALWVANGTNVVEFLPAQLSPGSTSMVPHLVNNSGVFGAPQGVVFDQAGDLWVIDGGTVAAGGTVKPALYKFTPAQLAALATTNNPTPAVTINSATSLSLNKPSSTRKATCGSATTAATPYLCLRPPSSQPQT